MQTVITIAVIVFVAAIIVFGLLSVLKELLDRDFVGSPLMSGNGSRGDHPAVILQTDVSGANHANGKMPMRGDRVAN
jgi:hypothetical protein